MKPPWCNPRLAASGSRCVALACAPHAVASCDARLVRAPPSSGTSPGAARHRAAVSAFTFQAPRVILVHRLTCCDCCYFGRDLRCPLESLAPTRCAGDTVILTVVDSTAEGRQHDHSCADSARPHRNSGHDPQLQHRRSVAVSRGWESCTQPSISNQPVLLSVLIIDIKTRRYIGSKIQISVKSRRRLCPAEAQMFCKRHSRALQESSQAREQRTCFLRPVNYLEG